MSTEFQFGVTKEKITKKEGMRRDEIAIRHGGNFIGPVSIPGNEVKGWFVIDNKGEPFNSRTAKAILAEAGLAE